MSQEDLLATGRQRSQIAKLGFLLGVESPIESGVMSMAQAGKQIRHLSMQLKLRRRRSPSMVRTFQMEFRRRIR